MKPVYASIREKVNAPARQYGLLELPPAVANRLALRASSLPIYQRSRAEEESWWAQVWAERGLPDPVTVSVETFREAVKARTK